MTTVIVMGVSGVGKSVVAKALVESTGWTLAEGDDFHPPANVEKMKAGTPLDDADRWPWLRSIAAWIGEQERAGHSSVITCSALKRGYRDLLREGHPSVRFCQLDASTGVLQSRMEARREHYMPPPLLHSQLRTLQSLEGDEPGGRVNAEGDLHTVLRRVLHLLAGHNGPAAEAAS
ncbi:MAG: gluconokinase [Actinomycetota bacterium]|nr:gluconokinase [Actinomycetota bacterium]